MDWMMNFRTIGIWIGVIGIINFLLLVDHPNKVGIIVDESEEVRHSNQKSTEEERGEPKVIELKTLNNPSNQEEIDEIKTGLLN